MKRYWIEHQSQPWVGVAEDGMKLHWGKKEQRNFCARDAVAGGGRADAVVRDGRVAVPL